MFIGIRIYIYFHNVYKIICSAYNFKIKNKNINF